jgi:hypothetical protein
VLIADAVDEVGIVKTGDAAIADEAGGAVRNDVGREQYEIVPTAAVDGKIADETLTDGLRGFSALRVEQRRFGGNGDLGRDGSSGKRTVDSEGLANCEDKVFVIKLGEVAAAEDDLIVTRLEEGGAVNTIAIGDECPGRSSVGIDDNDLSIGNDGPTQIGDRSGDSPRANGLGGGHASEDE